ncbi:type II toxin-antitoxin system Phd/YefM family antitoxin [Deinococcus pimensis]|uniref:type II toxin-antitoxin system Phd/YefM family antitoxin n=1 Tax=Deinococcus pimensis TaxID=309888 RepID=UPI00047FDB0F|nr:type II toxin-antitoxin system Phd/YefM family antitoxin [Deinococcus pimensis]
MTKTWKLEDAKAHLSQLIRDAEHEAQVITRHGRAAGVVLSPVEYQRLLGTHRTALSTFEDAPDLSDLDLTLARSTELREFDL